MNYKIFGIFFLCTLFVVVFSTQSCNPVKKSGGGFNLFTVEQDMELGKQVQQQIASDPKQFPLLDEASNREIYRYVRGIAQKLLRSGNVAHRNEFAWEVYIIDDPNTLNAFCTPGGYIYVYTGLIKFLDSEEQLAGVMGHEIAHAAQRHSTRQMTKIYGIQSLTAIATGKSEPGMIEQVALGLVNLKFSRAHETEADAYSVNYLCKTDYQADGAADFFKKMEGQPRPPQFLSTHPNPGNRVEKIIARKGEMNCRGNKTYKTEYQKIKKLIK